MSTDWQDGFIPIGPKRLLPVTDKPKINKPPEKTFEHLSETELINLHFDKSETNGT